MNRSVRNSLKVMSLCALTLAPGDVQSMVPALASVTLASMKIPAALTVLAAFTGNLRWNYVKEQVNGRYQVVGVDPQKGFSVLKEELMARAVDGRKELPVAGVDEVFASTLNKLLCFARKSHMDVTLSRDWHTPKHMAATVNVQPNKGNETTPNDDMPWGYTWARHCEQNTLGAQFFVAMRNSFAASFSLMKYLIPKNDLLITKGDDDGHESFSIFEKIPTKKEAGVLDAMQGKEETEDKSGFENATVIVGKLQNRVTVNGKPVTVEEYYRRKNTKFMLFTGVAFDYCVRESWKSAVIRGFDSGCIINASQGIANIFAANAEEAGKIAADKATANQEGDKAVDLAKAIAIKAYEDAIKNYTELATIYKRKFSKDGEEKLLPFFYDNSLGTRPMQDYQAFVTKIGGKLYGVDSAVDIATNGKKSRFWWFKQFFWLSK